MIWVFGSILVGLALAAVGAYAVLRVEFKDGRPQRFTWRVGLAALQAYLSTWAVVQVAAQLLLDAAPLDESAAHFATLLTRVTLATLLLWTPFAVATLALAAVAVRKGDRDALPAPLFAAATYGVALLAVSQAGWLTGPLGE